jgi:hypothetical protein
MKNLRRNANTVTFVTPPSRSKRCLEKEKIREESIVIRVSSTLALRTCVRAHARGAGL